MLKKRKLSYMLRKLYLLGFVLLTASSSLFAQVGAGTLKGKLTDAATGEPLPFVNIVVQNGGAQVAGGATDFDGAYTIKPIQPGTYDVLVSYVGYNAKQIQGVKVSSEKITFLDIKLESGIKLSEFEVVEYEVPLIDKDGGSSGGTVSREDISKMPGRSATSIASTVGGVVETGNGVSMRGAREGNTFYYIDGIKVRGSTNLPKAAIEEVTVITGGIPASYGDATGGIIAITTRGATRQYFGGIDVLTSGFANEDGGGVGLDRFSQTQIEGVLSGPLLWQKDADGNKTRPVLGFFVSGNYRNSMDNRPTIGNYRLKSDAQNRLAANPLSFALNNVSDVITGDVYIDEETGQPVPVRVITPSVQGIGNSEFIKSNDWEEVPARQNDRRQGVSLTGKLDIATNENFDFAVGGTYDWVKDNVYSYNNSLMNSQNNGESINTTWRAFGRFTHRLSSSDNESDGIIKNAYYSIMLDYSQSSFKQWDPNHEDRLFNYGYVGKFETNEVANYAYRDANDTTAFGYYQNGFRVLETKFKASDVNSELAAYTSNLYSYYDELGYTVGSGDDIQAAGALLNGQSPNSVYGLYNATGNPFNSYQLSETNQFRATASGSADIGNHALRIGFEFEQFTARSFGSNPISLWTQARQLANGHIQQLDFNSATETQINGETYYSYDRLISLSEQSTFDRNLRLALGYDPNGSDVIYVDELDPNLFELDMFSADELLVQGGNSSLVGYNGYDYKGEKLTGSRPTIDDFFTETDENGNLTRPIGAFEPTYIAGYIMDKFAFDDIIFNVGVRVDRFDANQAVLKDQFVVGEAYTAQEIQNIFQEGEDGYVGEFPSNVGDDWVVYVNDINNPTAINGFRDENTWYNSNGVEIADPRTIRTASGIAPYLKNPNEVGENLTSGAFEDYKPQWNVMPRIAFSFPISDEAVFFAHYDILTQRPTGQNIVSPVDYLFLQNLGNNAVNNPNLRPTRTTDYELGFQQVLSRSSSLKIAAYYRLSQDEIQARQLLEAYPVTYTSFDNFDFGNTQGLTLTYDLRRTGNVTLRASYTLQFASATGSSAGSSLNLVNSGEPNLRVVFPTNRDQRHQLITTFDYRYGSGKDYNGPTIGNSQIFANTGLNLVGILGSGSPYSSQLNQTGDAFINGSGTSQLEGTINGSRLPWQYTFNMQIDKSWTLSFGKDGEKQKQAFLNVYLLINNLLNTQNILGVYRYTGNPDDDGYLASPIAQPSIRTQIDEQAFRQQYALKAANPFNYSSPRTIQLGVRLDF